MNLQELIAQNGSSQVKIAKKLHLSESQVSLLVSGSRRMSLEYAAGFAEELGVSIDEIFLALNFAKCKDRDAIPKKNNTTSGHVATG